MSWRTNLSDKINLMDMESKIEKKTYSRKYAWLFLAIIMSGIFLRTYHFHDWLRFNADQGRDAMLVRDVVEGKSAWPLLGPKAGGTDFKLGGVFYYFEIISAKIFGAYPDRMAYPDLFSSILCIPLLFFFLRKYFNLKISLISVMLFAISLYAIQYSRFSWNPNSAPFWSILALYALHEVIAKKVNNKLLWAIVSGVVIGIGMQLHSTLLLFLPITTIILFGILVLRRFLIVRYFFVILFIALFLNLPQLVSEYQTGGSNAKAFFGGMETKQEGGDSLVSRIWRDTSCFTQGNINILSGYEISNECVLKVNRKGDVAIFALGFAFLLGGIALGLRSFWQEKDYDKKAFLGIVFLYSAIAYIIFIPLAYEISMRFFLVLIFMPFMLLGFWLSFFSEKLLRNRVDYLYAIVTLIFAGLNIFFVSKYFINYLNYDKGMVTGGQIDAVTLKEVEGVSNFIITNSGSASIVYISGNQQYLFKAIKPIEFFVKKAGIEIAVVRKNDEKKFPLFLIDSLKSKRNNSSAFGRFSIWKEDD